MKHAPLTWKHIALIWVAVFAFMAVRWVRHEYFRPEATITVER